MTLLAIETSTRQLGIAVSDGTQVLAAYEVLGDYPHALELPGAVSRVLKESRATLGSLEAIVVDIGPGSFTGCRIGVAFVKALVAARKTPLIGIASLDVLAAQVPAATVPVYPVLDARQGNVYLAKYQVQGAHAARQSDYLLGPIETVLAESSQPALFLGDGAAKFQQQIIARVPKAVFLPAELGIPRAPTLARLGAERLQKRQVDDPARLTPLYLYPMDCSVRSPERTTSVIPKPVAAV